MLRKADRGEGGPACDDAAIATAIEFSRPTVERVRRSCAVSGLAAARTRKAWTGPSRRKRDGVQEAHLACSQPSEGAKRWTLTVLADTLVERTVVESIAIDTVRRALKQTNASRG